MKVENISKSMITLLHNTGDPQTTQGVRGANPPCSQNST